MPAPSGAAPYRLGLGDVVGEERAAEVEHAGALVFHATGDTGGRGAAEAQQIVALHMQREVEDPDTAAAFLVHLGDVVYHHGERREYYAQFYERYALYPAPILAIAGNHDADPAPGGEPSLAAFVDNFCAPDPVRTPEANESERDAMTQPHVHWTLTTPLVTIIGLYTNVPEGGHLDEPQLVWLRGELAAAPREAALVVCCHQPPYSWDVYQSQSPSLEGVLDDAFTAAGRTPDLVLSGHIHSYQRFTRTTRARDTTYAVAGAGGYWYLHPMADEALAGARYPGRSDLRLDAYCDDRHGYLRITATRSQLTGEYVTVPRPHESWRNGPAGVIDAFTIDLTDGTIHSTPGF